MSEPWEEFGLSQEIIDSSRRYFAELTGERFEDVPWEVVFVDPRPLTREEAEAVRDQWARREAEKV